MIKVARRSAPVLLAAAGLLWITALFVPLTSYGTGSTEPSHELADLTLSGVSGVHVSHWVGLAWYGTGLIGCVVLGTCALDTAPIAAIRLICGTVATSLAAYAGLELGRSVSTGFGPAVWISCAAWALCLLGTAAGRCAQSPPTTRTGH